MNIAYASPLAALAGWVIGALTTFAAIRFTRRQQANVNALIQDQTAQCAKAYKQSEDPTK